MVEGIARHNGVAGGQTRRHKRPLDEGDPRALARQARPCHLQHRWIRVKAPQSCPRLVRETRPRECAGAHAEIEDLADRSQRVTERIRGFGDELVVVRNQLTDSPVVAGRGHVQVRGD